MCRRKSNLVDPQFWRFVRMDVVDSGCKTDDQAIVDSDSDVMSRVFKKFLRQFRINWVVEHRRRHGMRTFSSPRCRTLISMAIVLPRVDITARQQNSGRAMKEELNYELSTHHSAFP